MDFNISGRAQQFIQENGNVITVIVEKRLLPNCSGAPALTSCPTVRLGTPADNEAGEYLQSDKEGIKVFLHATSTADYKSEKPLLVDLEKNLFAINLIFYGAPGTNNSCMGCTSC